MFERAEKTKTRSKLSRSVESAIICVTGMNAFNGSSYRIIGHGFIPIGYPWAVIARSLGPPSCWVVGFYDKEQRFGSWSGWPPTISLSVIREIHVELYATTADVRDSRIELCNVLFGQAFAAACQGSPAPPRASTGFELNIPASDAFQDWSFSTLPLGGCSRSEIRNSSTD